VEIEATKRVLDRIETAVENGRLKIRDASNFFERMFDDEEDGTVDVYVTAPTIEGISLAGSGRVEGETPIESASLALENAGSGAMDLAVTTTDLRVSVAGSGTFDLRGTAESVTVQIAGRRKSWARGTWCIGEPPRLTRAFSAVARCGRRRSKEPLDGGEPALAGLRTSTDSPVPSARRGRNAAEWQAHLNGTVAAYGATGRRSVAPNFSPCPLKKYVPAIRPRWSPVLVGLARQASWNRSQGTPSMYRIGIPIRSRRRVGNQIAGDGG
jgi:hypothetical protein